MWIPNRLFQTLEATFEDIKGLRDDLTAARSERDLLKSQLGVAQNNFEWLRLRVNQLEHERAQLIEKAYGIKTAVPEVIRRPDRILDQINQFTFEDVGDDVAKQLGLPVYTEPR